MITKSTMVKKYPTDYKVVKIKTLFKKGEKTDVGNYRPISIPSQVSKFIEGQVCKEMDIYLEERKILNDNQWGFRKGKSTEGLLLSLTENWKQELDEGKVVGVLFVDCRKAFNSVDREILKKKL